jgi:hypothetical protein
LLAPCVRSLNGVSSWSLLPLGIVPVSVLLFERDRSPRLSCFIKCIHTECRMFYVVAFLLVSVVFPYTAACAVIFGTVVVVVADSCSSCSFLSSHAGAGLLVDIGSFRFSNDRTGLVVSTTGTVAGDSADAAVVLLAAVVVVDGASDADVPSVGFVSVVPS